MDKDRLEDDVHSDIEIEQDWPTHPFNIDEKQDDNRLGGGGLSPLRPSDLQETVTVEQLKPQQQRESGGESDARSQMNLSLTSEIDHGIGYSPEASEDMDRQHHFGPSENMNSDNKSSSSWNFSGVVKKCRNFVTALCSSNH